MASQRKPARWAWQPGLIDPVWREIVGRAYAIPMLDPSPELGSAVYGRGRALALPQVAGSTTPVRSSAGRGAGFNGAPSASGLSVAGLTHAFSRVSGAVVVLLPALDTGENYFTLAARGSIFANGTNWGVDFRQDVSGSIKTEFNLYHRTTGGNLEGWVSTDGLTNDDVKVGQVATYSWSYDGLKAEMYIDGVPLGGSFAFGASAMSTAVSSDPLTIGAGSRHSGASRTWNGHIYSALIGHDAYWTNEQHALLARHPFGWVKRRAYFIPAAAASGNITVTPASGNVTTSSTSPTIVLGDATINLGNQTGVSATSPNPTVVINTGSVSITPASADATTTSTSPTVVKGSIAISLGSQTGLTSSASPGTLVKGSITIDLSNQASLTSTASLADILLGSTSVTPASADVTSSADIGNIVDQPAVAAEEKASGWQQKHQRIRKRLL